MTGDYEATIPGDYPTRPSDYKLCPLKPATIRDVLAVCDEDLRRFGAVKVPDGTTPMKTISGQCDGPHCAWWDASREKCGILPRK